MVVLFRKPSSQNSLYTCKCLSVSFSLQSPLKSVGLSLATVAFLFAFLKFSSFLKFCILQHIILDGNRKAGLDIYSCHMENFAFKCAYNVILVIT